LTEVKSPRPPKTGTPDSGLSRGKGIDSTWHAQQKVIANLDQSLHIERIRHPASRREHQETTTMKTLALSLTLASSLVLVACGTTTGSRTGSGAAVGAATGAAIGSLSGNAGKGALIGAGAGALGGYVYDKNKKQEEYDRGYRNRDYDDHYQRY